MSMMIATAKQRRARSRAFFALMQLQGLDFQSLADKVNAVLNGGQKVTWESLRSMMTQAGGEQRLSTIQCAVVIALLGIHMGTLSKGVVHTWTLNANLMGVQKRYIESLRLAVNIFAQGMEAYSMERFAVGSRMCFPILMKDDQGRAILLRLFEPRIRIFKTTVAGLIDAGLNIRDMGEIEGCGHHFNKEILDGKLIFEDFLEMVSGRSPGSVDDVRAMMLEQNIGSKELRQLVERHRKPQHLTVEQLLLMGGGKPQVEGLLLTDGSTNTIDSLDLRSAAAIAITKFEKATT